VRGRGKPGGETCPQRNTLISTTLTCLFLLYLSDLENGLSKAARLGRQPGQSASRDTKYLYRYYFMCPGKTTVSLLTAGGLSNLNNHHHYHAETLVLQSTVNGSQSRSEALIVRRRGRYIFINSWTFSISQVYETTIKSSLLLRMLCPSVSSLQKLLPCFQKGNHLSSYPHLSFC
jgi:hypothetical protein